MRRSKGLFAGAKGARYYSNGKDVRSRRIFPQQRSVKAAYYRGGTSRAVMFREEDLPPKDTRSAFFLHVMGSSDRHGRQLNGMGAGISSLSKICLINPSKEQGIDVEYTFVGLGIENDEVDYAGNCGNMASAVGPYAFNERLLRDDKGYDGEEGEVTVRILNTNTDRVIRSTFTVAHGEARVDDLTAIDGVSGLGTGVYLEFEKLSGAKTGKLLPTGNVVDTICGIEVSCIDAANPCIFVRAQDLDIDPTILPAALLEDATTLRKLEDIRSAGAVAMGICQDASSVPRVIPKIAIVNTSCSQKTLSGDLVPASELDLVVRFISDTQPHRAIPLTGALCVAAAAKTHGSIVQQCLGERLVDDNFITIGHASGKIQVNATLDDRGKVENCAVVRTARRLMEGTIFWTDLSAQSPAQSNTVS